MKHLLLLVAATSLFSIAAHSDIYEDGLSAAIKDSRETLEGFSNLQMEEQTQKALNIIISATNEALAERGFVKEAQTYQQEWNQNFAQYFSTFQNFDLGDHAPLSPWLDNYYKKAEDKLGEPVMKILHFDDIRIINYGFPVVFHPSGDTKGQDHWNQLEYQRHFIPFSAAVTFWGSLGACRIVAMNVTAMKKWCGTVSTILRSVVKSSVGAKLSDAVYKKYSGKTVNPKINYDEIERYTRDQAEGARHFFLQ